MNPNSKKPTSDVIAGKIGKPFIQSSARRLDMKAPVKGNLQGAQEKAVSRIIPTGAASWAGYTKPNMTGPPKSTNWRATDGRPGITAVTAPPGARIGTINTKPKLTPVTVPPGARIGTIGGTKLKPVTIFPGSRTGFIRK